MPKFNTGSYIGCGINYFKREIFFTFNGKYYGRIYFFEIIESFLILYTNLNLIEIKYFRARI